MKYINGLVSVIIPTYKRTDTLIRAIDSVLSQTYQKIECIVVNDNDQGDECTHAIKKLLKKYTNCDKLVFLQQMNHKNGAAARNLGIKEAKGEYIAFLDDDDWWKDEKIECQLECIKRQDSQCAIVSTLVEFYNNGKLVRRTVPYTGGYVYREILGREIDVTTCALLIKHVCLDEIGYFDENLRRHQELQLLTNLTYKYKLELVPVPLTCVDTDDVSNRASGIDELFQMKKEFFLSVRSVLETFTKKERECIYALHRLDIVYLCLKKKEYMRAFIHIIRIAIHPQAMVKLIFRLIRRWKESRVEKEEIYDSI